MLLCSYIKAQFKDRSASLPVNDVAYPVLLKGPYLQAATSNSIVIRWRTAAAGGSIVRYGTRPEKLKANIKVTVADTEHVVKLPGLKPQTKYYYSIGESGNIIQGDSDNYFITPPIPGTIGKYRIAAFGDCGNNSPNQRNVKKEIIKYLGNNYLDAWLLLGDNAYEYGTDDEYKRNFFPIFKDDLLKKSPLFPTPGNHDYREVDKSTGLPKKTHEVAYYKNFTLPVDGEAGGAPSHNPSYYSFDIGNIHFLSLDSYGKEEGGLRMYDTLSPQVQWVKDDLQSNKNKGWVIAYWHHPPYTMGSHNSDKEQELVKIRENFIRILERLGVDMVISGHSHSYERSKLINGYYGNEASFNTGKNNVSQSSGLYNETDNSCPYLKDSLNDKGIVYVVSGSAGKIDSKTQAAFPHDAMYYSNAVKGGALMMEVEDNRLDVKWICADGVIRDHFTMMKNVNRLTKIKLKKTKAVTLTASYNGKYKWNLSNENSKSIEVLPPAGVTKYTVHDTYNCVTDEFEIEVSK